MASNKLPISIQGLLVPSDPGTELVSSSNVMGGYHIVTSQTEYENLLSVSSVGLQEVGMIINLHIDGENDKYFRIKQIAYKSGMKSYSATTEEISFGGSDTLSEDITTTNSVGGYDTNVTISAGTKLEDIIRQLLEPEISASTSETKVTTLTASVGLSASSDYSGGTVSITSITVTANHSLTYYTINQTTKEQDTIIEKSPSYEINVKYGNTNEYSEGPLSSSTSATSNTFVLDTPLVCGTFSESTKTISGFVSANTTSDVLSGATYTSKNNKQCDHVCYYGSDIDKNSTRVVTSFSTKTMNYRVRGGYASLSIDEANSSTSLEPNIISALTSATTSTTVPLLSSSAIASTAQSGYKTEISTTTIPANTFAYILIPSSRNKTAAYEKYTSAANTPYTAQMVKIESKATMDGITYDIFLTPTKYPSDTGVKDGTKITLSD